MSVMAGRWYGWLARLLIGLSGILLGALLVLVATFGASFKRDMPDWGAKEVVFLCFGLVIIGFPVGGSPTVEDVADGLPHPRSRFTPDGCRHLIFGPESM